jgi:hypothetical protein
MNLYHEPYIFSFLVVSYVLFMFFPSLYFSLFNMFDLFYFLSTLIFLFYYLLFF